MNIYNLPKYACRCRDCRHRQTLKKHPDQYHHVPKCNDCGSINWSVDLYRSTKKEAKKYTCNCGGFPFPHHRGSVGQDTPYFCLLGAAA